MNCLFETNQNELILFNKLYFNQNRFIEQRMICRSCHKKQIFIENSLAANKERVRQLKKERKKKQQNDKKQQFIKSNIQRKKWFFMLDSCVVKQAKEIICLLGTFSRSQKPIGFELLFRASDYNFDVKRKKEKYCGVEHTLLLVKTEFGKIIGGYTPLKWKKHFCQSQYDTTGKSFIFSVSNDHKFTLKLPITNKAILHDDDFGPIFMSGICINDKSNTKNKSRALYRDQLRYVHPEYYSKDKESWMKFVGSSDGYFLIQQWEMHRVIFEE